MKKALLVLKCLLDIVLPLCVLAASGVVIYRVYSPAHTSKVAPEIPQQVVSLKGDPTLGSADAPVVLIEYSDFECPFCGAFVKTTLPAIRGKYINTGKVRLAFRHLPLRQIHPAAVSAATAAECARQQGRFWEAHDQLFLHGVSIASKGPDFARRLGLNVTKFADCIARAGRLGVYKDVVSGTGLKVSATPTFFVGRALADDRVALVRRFSGAQQLSQFDAVIQDILRDRQQVVSK